MSRAQDRGLISIQSLDFNTPNRSEYQSESDSKRLAGIHEAEVEVVPDGPFHFKTSACAIPFYVILSLPTVFFCVYRKSWQQIL